jgi:hypothetical protein
MAGKLRQVIFDIGLEVNSHTRLIVEIEYYVHYLNRAANEVTGTGLELLRKAAIVNKRAGQAVHPKILAALEVLLKQIEAEKAAMKQVRG